MTSKLYYFIVCLFTIFAASLGDEEKRCTIAYGKADQCPYDIMCPGDGQGVMVDYVVISNTADCKGISVRNSDRSNDLDRAIMSTIRSECNGKKTCNLDVSLRNRFTVQCDGKTYYADVMDIRYYCKPLAFNQSSVYNVYDDLISEKVKDTFYLVLAEDDIGIHRSCSVRSALSSFSFRLLNVDLEESKSCRRLEAPAICQDTMTIDGDSQRLVTYTRKYPPEILETHVIHNIFNLDVNTSSGLLWIEFTAKDTVYLSCQGGSKDDMTSRKITTPTTTTTTTTTPEVTTPTTVENTTALRNVTAAFEFIKQSTDNPAIPTVYIYIVVLAVVAMISLVANVVLFKKYCENRKPKKEDHYSYIYPTLQNQGSYTYSAISEDAKLPASPAPRDAADRDYIDPVDDDTEYLGVTDSGGDYNETVPKYNIQQDSGHSITDNASY